MAHRSELALWLDEHRQAAELSYAEISRRMTRHGIAAPTRTVRSWFQGERLPRTGVVFESLLAVLGVVRPRDLDEAGRLRSGIRTSNRVRT